VSAGETSGSSGLLLTDQRLVGRAAGLLAGESLGLLLLLAGKNAGGGWSVIDAEAGS
jgi:hypothetical protein